MARPEHNLRVKAVERIASATQNTEWFGRLYLVGGAVRDPLLGLEMPNECDIVVEGDAIELVNFLYATGISELHPVVYPRFGTAMLHIDGSNVEFVSARKESYAEQSRKPNVQAASLLEDAQRRDFTINALMRNIHSGELLDLLGTGIEDLNKRVLRTPLEPVETFRDDPLRMLRAVRLKNRLNFAFAPGVAEAISKEASRLKIISAERIRDELIKMLLDRSAPQSLKDLMSLGLMREIAPEFVDAVGVEQGAYHDKDVWEHTLDVVEMAARGKYENDEERLIVILAAALHDIGKPSTKSVESTGRVRFFGHDKRGAEIAEAILTRLRFPRKTVQAVSKLVGNHMRLGSAPEFTKAAARRLLRDMGELTEPFLLLCEADAAAIGRIPKPIPFDEIRSSLAEVQKSTESAPLDSPLSGEEIMSELGLGPGPKVGEWKQFLQEAVIEGVIEQGDKEGARKLIARARNQREID
jgi:poly(A) polymerase